MYTASATALLLFQPPPNENVKLSTKMQDFGTIYQNYCKVFQNQKLPEGLNRSSSICGGGVKELSTFCVCFRIKIVEGSEPALKGEGETCDRDS